MCYNLKLITAPTIEPISEDEAISYMRLGALNAAESSYLSGLIKTAREYCETYQNRAYITQTWEMSLNRFPTEKCGIIYIPKGNLQTIDSIKYTDSSGTTTTLTENTDYIVTTSGILGRVSPPYGENWPTATLYPLDPIKITFTCGYGDSKDDVQSGIIQAMYMLISYWWDNRTAADVSVPRQVEFSVKALLSSDRIMTV